MQLTLLRHAESVYNKKKILQGRIDCDLSDKGIKDTIDKSKNFDSSKYDICFCSPLKRTVRTAEILVPNLSIIKDSRLIERSLGDWEDTPISDEKTFLLNNINSTPPKGESILDIISRVKEFIEYLKENYSDKKILVITHAGVIYAIQIALKLEKQKIDNLETLIIDNI